nr:NPF-2 [Urechis unicinctus]
MATHSSAMSLTIVVYLATVCVLMLACDASYSDDYDRDNTRIAALSHIEPPRRPAQFRNVDELNQYLAELRQYYSILGRPRFGRSVERALGSMTESQQSRRLNHLS